MGNATLSTVSIMPRGRCSGEEPLFQHPDDNDPYAELSGSAGDLSHKARLAPGETMTLIVDYTVELPRIRTGYT